MNGSEKDKICHKRPHLRLANPENSERGAKMYELCMIAFESHLFLALNFIRAGRMDPLQ